MAKRKLAALRPPAVTTEQKLAIIKEAASQGFKVTLEARCLSCYLLQLEEATRRTGRGALWETRSFPADPPAPTIGERESATQGTCGRKGTAHTCTPQENGHVESFHSIISQALKYDRFAILEQLEQRLVLF